MKVVLDVSGAFSALSGDEVGNQILGMLESADGVFAPDLFYAEACNVAWKFHYIKGMPISKCLQMSDFVIAMIDEFEMSASLWKDSLQWSLEYNHPAYDWFYLILAKRQDAVLISLDKKMSLLAEKIGVTMFNTGQRF